jgi:hypothetical protein
MYSISNQKLQLYLNITRRRKITTLITRKVTRRVLPTTTLISRATKPQKSRGQLKR